MHDNKHVHSPVIITTTLYGMRMAHIFIWVCVLIYNGVSLSIFTRHLGHQYLPPKAEVIPRLDADATGQGHAARPRLLRLHDVWMEQAH